MPWRLPVKRHFKHGSRPVLLPPPLILPPIISLPPAPIPAPRPLPPSPPKLEEGEIRGGLGYIMGCLGRRGI